MFISENFIFVQVQKTGSTHITRCLQSIYDGKQTTKHAIPKRQQITGGKDILASIRNPWEWYLSLWAYGCERKGGLYQRLTHFTFPNRSLIHHPLGLLSWPAHEVAKHRKDWKDCYSDASNPLHFRLWLKMLHSINFRFDHGDSYSYCKQHGDIGFFSYRVLVHTCKNFSRIKKEEELSNFFSKNSFVTDWIRTEHIESDISDLAKKHPPKRPLSNIPKGKTNQTKNRKSTQFYYDAETKELVEKSDQFLIEKFGYDFPGGSNE